MKEYIELGALIAKLRKDKAEWELRAEPQNPIEKFIHRVVPKLMQDVIEFIEKFPVTNVVEVKRGNWAVTECDSGEPEGYPAFIEFHCPFCNEPYSLESGEYNWCYGDAIPFNFCHECGADMREKEEKK